jgi:microcystin-dependent protein
MPIGSIVMWPLTEKPPNKWRICDGQLVKPSPETELFRKIFKNAAWTKENGNIVYVPDLRGYFIRGADDRNAEKVDEDAPRGVGQVQADQLPNHTLDISNLKVAAGALAYVLVPMIVGSLNRRLLHCRIDYCRVYSASGHPTATGVARLPAHLKFLNEQD